MWPRRRVLSPRAALLAGRALPQRLERNVPLRKSTHTRKGKGAPSCTTGCSTAHPHPAPLASHLGVASRRDRASGQQGPAGGGKGRRAAAKTPGWGVRGLRGADRGPQRRGVLPAGSEGPWHATGRKPRARKEATRPEGSHAPGRKPRARKEGTRPEGSHAPGSGSARWGGGLGPACGDFGALEEPWKGPAGSRCD